MAAVSSARGGDGSRDAELKRRKDVARANVGLNVFHVPPCGAGSTPSGGQSRSLPRTPTDVGRGTCPRDSADISKAGAAPESPASTIGSSTALAAAGWEVKSREAGGNLPSKPLRARVISRSTSAPRASSAEVAEDADVNTKSTPRALPPSPMQLLRNRNGNRASPRISRIRIGRTATSARPPPKTTVASRSAKPPPRTQAGGGRTLHTSHVSHTPTSSPHNDLDNSRVSPRPDGNFRLIPPAAYHPTSSQAHRSARRSTELLREQYQRWLHEQQQEKWARGDSALTDPGQW